MKIGDFMTIYVRALSNGQWFGGWAPIRARLEWTSPEKSACLFTLMELGLTEEDEYAFYQLGTLVLAQLEKGDYRVQGGLIPPEITGLR